MVQSGRHAFRMGHAAKSQTRSFLQKTLSTRRRRHNEAGDAVNFGYFVPEHDRFIQD